MMSGSRMLLCFLLLAVSASAHAAAKQTDVISLDGQWQIIFDADNKSRELRLFESEKFLARDDRRLIEVPSVWERIEKDYEGVAVYHRTFDVPARWQGKIVHLAFDAVNYRAEVYVNDNVVGVHEGGFTPFRFRVDSMLEVGQENVVTVRIVGPVLLQLDKVIDGMIAKETPQWRGGITGGIWQSVRLEASGNHYIDDVYIEPDIHRNEARVTLQLNNFDEFASDEQVRLSVVDKSQRDRTVASTVADIKLQPGKNTWSGTLAIPDAKYWSPDAPNLYLLKVEISEDGQSSDAVSEQFGLREFTVKNKRFYLNGEEIFLKAVFLEGQYPVGVGVPADIELARKEIRRAKEAGFNMIRPWRRPPPPEWMDLADEMGVMLIGSPVVECMDLPVSSPDLPGRVMYEIRQSILRDRNRASVVMWELFNELRRPILKQMMHESVMTARDTDPSRLIYDESGGWAFGAKMYLPYEREYQYFNDVHEYPGPAMNNQWMDRFLAVAYDEDERRAMGIDARPIGHNVKPDVTTFISEIGYGSYPDFTTVNQKFRDSGNPILPAMRDHLKLEAQTSAVIEAELSDIYPSPQAFYLEQQHIHGLANARMVEAARSNPRVAGYCIHALTGGDWVLGAGLLDLWREPKEEVYARTKAANQPRILSIRTWPRNAYQGSPVKVNVLGINDIDPVDGALTVTVRSADNTVVWEETKPARLNQYVNELLVASVNTDDLEGTYTVDARFTDERGNLIAANAYDIDVFSLKVPDVGNFAVLDQTGKLTNFLDEHGLSYSNFSSAASVDTPVFVAMAPRPNSVQEDANQALTDFVRKGGVAYYVQFPFSPGNWKDGMRTFGRAQNMPIDFGMKASVGLWGGMSHVIPDHPLFDGLPVKRAMYGIYENVRADHTAVDISGDKIVKMVANDNMPNMNINYRHYLGTGDVWVGSDVTVVDYGEGKLVVSTMKLLNNLRADPVADKIMLNMLEMATGGQE